MGDELKVADLEEQIMVNQSSQIKNFLSKRKKQAIKFYKDEAIRTNALDTLGLNIFSINKYLFEPLTEPTRVIKRYTAWELLEVLEFFQEQLIQINTYVMYPPQLELYCRLLGISTKTFKDYYLNSNDAEMRNAAQQVIDYIGSSLNFAGMTRQIDNQAQIFAQKTTLSKKENDQPTVTNNNQTLVISADEFKRQLSELVKK